MTNQLIEYIKLHKLSLIQDLEDARNNIDIPEDEYFESDEFYLGAIEATDHLLSVASDILSTNERNTNGWYFYPPRFLHKGY